MIGRMRIKMIVAWPVLFIIDLGLWWTGERTWREAREETRRLCKRI